MCYLKRAAKLKLRTFMHKSSDSYWCKWHMPLIKTAYAAILGVSLMINIALFCVVTSKEIWKYGEYIQAKKLYCEALWRCPIAERKF